MITDLNQINYQTHEGRLLMAALAIITSESRTSKTPHDVILELNNLSEHMFRDEPKINELKNEG